MSKDRFSNSKANVARGLREIGIKPSKVSAGNSAGKRETLSDVAKRVQKRGTGKRETL